MFHDVVRKNQVKAGVLKRNFAGICDASLVKHGVVQDTRIKINTVNSRKSSAEVHLFNDAGTCTEVEYMEFGVGTVENSLPEQSIIPILRCLRVKVAI